MTKQTEIFLIFFIALTACSHPTTGKIDVSGNDTTTGAIADQNYSESASANKVRIRTDGLPIHGELSRQLVENYYPEITDTIKDLRILGSEPLDIQTNSDIYVSMLHNSGTFDQMFLCTHDKMFNLLDCFYVGTSSMFDVTSHTIEYKKVSNDRLEFSHVDWRYVNNEVDTVKYQKYILVVTKSGRIEKR